MLIDSAGLGYTFRHGEILVHYPTRAVGESPQGADAPGTSNRYGVGWPIGPIPATYALDPPNAITAERVRLWMELQSAASAEED